MRFEKQLQPEQAMDAQAVGDPADDRAVRRDGRRAARSTSAATGRLRRRSGCATRAWPGCWERRSSAAGADEILRSLEFTTREAPDGLDVEPPYFRRGDVTREADVIEEVARLDGLEKLPSTLPSRHGARGRLTPRQRLRRRASDLLAAQGLYEIVGWSFTGPDTATRLRAPDDHPDAVVLRTRCRSSSRGCAPR